MSDGNQSVQIKSVRGLVAGESINLDPSVMLAPGEGALFSLVWDEDGTPRLLFVRKTYEGNVGTPAPEGASS